MNNLLTVSLFGASYPKELFPAPRDRHDLLLTTNSFGMALELLPALGELGDLGLINNLSGISLGSCRRRT